MWRHIPQRVIVAIDFQKLRGKRGVSSIWLKLANSSRAFPISLFASHILYLVPSQSATSAPYAKSNAALFPAAAPPALALGTISDGLGSIFSG